MSWAAMFWATKLTLKKPTDKLMLFAFADRHNDETGFAYPSIKWLCEYTSLNRKTVIQSIQRLEDGGYIEDSGRRCGATKQVKVYRVLVPEFEEVPKTEQYQKRNSTDFTAEQSQKRDTEPIREPNSTNVESNTKRARAFPDDWRPSNEDLDYGANQGLSPEEVSRAVEDFRDYFIAAGPSRKSTNWSLNWKRWCRTTADRAKKSRSGASVAGRQAPRGGGRENPSFAEIRARRNAGRSDGVEVSGSWSGVQGSDHGWSDGAIDGEATIRLLKD